MDVFTQHNIVEIATDVPSDSCSNFFPRLKKDDTAYSISMKMLNIIILKWKLQDILPLVTDNCFFASIDLKHAYYSVPVCLSS